MVEQMKFEIQCLTLMVNKNLQNQQNESSKVTQKRTKASTEVVDGQGPQVKIPRRGAGPIRESDLASQDDELDYDESGIKKMEGLIIPAPAHPPVMNMKVVRWTQAQKMLLIHDLVRSADDEALKQRSQK